MPRPLAPIACLVLAATPADGPGLTYTTGLALRQTWNTTHVRSIESSTMLVMEDEQDLGSGSTTTRTRELAALDTVLAATDGTLLGLRRDFETVRSSREVEGFEPGAGVELVEGEKVSPLEGLSAVFAREEDGGAFEAEWHEDSSGESDWLDGLRAEAWLAGLLPEEEVGSGDTWEVPAAFASELLRPLGEVNVEEEDDDSDDEEGMVRLEVPDPESLADLSEMGGTITARWEGTEEDGERELATIVLDLELAGSFDLTEELEEAASERGADESWEIADLDSTLEGEVTVVWDLTNGRPVSAVGELTGANAVDCAWTLNAGNFELPVEFDRESTDEIRFEATFEVAE